METQTYRNKSQGRKQKTKMDPSPPQYDKHSTMRHGSSDMIANTENEWMGMSECERNRGSYLDKKAIDQNEQNVSFEGNDNNSNYQKLTNENEINSCGSSSAVEDTEVQSATAIPCCGGTRYKTPEDSTSITAGRQAKSNEEVNVNRKPGGQNAKNEGFSNISSVDDKHVVNKNDIKLAQNRDEAVASEVYLKQKIKNEKVEIKTLWDALKYFNLYSRWQLLETSLEDVRRHKKVKEAHESEFKQFDKEIQKLSFKFHPDKVRNRGGSEEEMAIAQKLQTALNSTRTVLNVLSEAFLEDINMDHRYGYYTELNIGSLGNEDEVKNRVSEVLFKISFISEIKQRNIVAEIRNFLIESKNCVKFFFENNSKEFEKCRSSAFFHLKKCIKGYKKLLAEYDKVEEECRHEKQDNIRALIRKMSRGTSKNLAILKEIKKVAKKSLAGECLFYNTSDLDEYFVLPLASYINVVIMCNVMLKGGSQTLWENLWSTYQNQTESVYCPDGSSILHYPYYLASFYSGNKKYKNIVKDIWGKPYLDMEEIEYQFSFCLEQLNEYMEGTFRIEDYYIENNRGNHLMQEYMKCMRMMADFKMKEEELRNDIKRLASRNQEIENKFDLAMRESEELSNKVNERLEQSKLLRERFSAYFPTA